MDDFKTITITLAGRPYPLRIKGGDENNIRKIVKTLNERINQFQMSYTSKDKQDCLAMTLLTTSVELHKYRNGASLQDAEKNLEDLEVFLDALLES